MNYCTVESAYRFALFHNKLEPGSVSNLSLSFSLPVFVTPALFIPDCEGDLCIQPISNTQVRYSNMKLFVFTRKDARVVPVSRCRVNRNPITIQIV